MSDEVQAGESLWPDLPERWRYSIELNATEDGHYGSTLELKCDGILMPDGPDRHRTQQAGSLPSHQGAGGALDGGLDEPAEGWRLVVGASWRCAGRADAVGVGALAESVRFELTDGCPSAVFKTAGLNHSPNSPMKDTHCPPRWSGRREPGF